MSVRTSRVSSPTIGLMVDNKFTRKITHFTIKNGKKQLAVRLVNRALSHFAIGLELGIDEVSAALEKVESSVMVLVGFFKRRMGSRSYSIPYMLTEDRSYKHSLKRFYNIVRKNQKRDFPRALADEMINVYRRSNSAVLNDKNRIYKEAKANRMMSYLIQKFKLKDPENLKIDLNRLTEV